MSVVNLSNANKIKVSKSSAISLSSPVKKSASTSTLSSAVAAVPNKAAKKPSGLTVVKHASGKKTDENNNTEAINVLEALISKHAAINGAHTPSWSGPDAACVSSTESKILTFSTIPSTIVESLLNMLSTDSTNPNSSRKTIANALVIVVEACGLNSILGGSIVTSMIEFIQLSTNKTTSMREGGILLLKGLITKFGRAMEPFIFQLIPHLLQFHSERSTIVRDLANEILVSISSFICPQAFRLIFPMLLVAMVDDDWRVKVGALTLLKNLAPRSSPQLSPLLPQLIPRVTECINESKVQVKTAAMEALKIACVAITNDDIRPLVPLLVSVIANPDESASTLDALLETTFVAAVDASVLALLAPLLGKALRGRSSILKRKASKVIDIMCRLVQEPLNVAPFVPLLLPALDKVIDEIVDAEVCEVAQAARDILLKAMGESDPTSAVNEDVAAAATAACINHAAESRIGLDLPTVEGSLIQALRQVLPSQNDHSNIVLDYIAKMTSQLVVYSTLPNPNPIDASELEVGKAVEPWRQAVAMTSQHDWRDCIIPYADGFIHGTSHSSCSSSNSTNSDNDIIVVEEAEKEEKEVEDSETISHAFRLAALGDVPDGQDDDDEDGANVCNIEFSLAYGGKILLQNTHLKLGKGRKYAVMGKNGVGKTTLLTNIGSGKIEGMPSYLKMVYVQHDDASDDFGIPLIDEITNGKDMIEAGVSKEEIEQALLGINFTPLMLSSPRSSLSGGWKMKVLMMRAMLAKANILLLDEPTNHLDTASVEWLTKYLQTNMEITCLIVSHDPKFLDNVITDVIHYEQKKLVYYKGNLTHFVQIHPEAQYYYELEASTMFFKFPTPDRLDGINSTTKSIMKIENTTYTYPGMTEPQLININVKVCLASRIAVIGANGAGKSTLIKLLVGESKPNEGCGEVWKHMNLRVSYVAQHSFHHIEQHLDVSPVDYIKWRFAGGVDREDLAKPTMKLTEQEETDLKTEKKYGDVEQVHGRRKNGRTMEYECSFFGQTSREPNKYIPLEKMEEMGLSKLVQQTDARVAAMAAGLDVRPLLTAEIQGHLNDFNLDAEFGTHGTIRRLSGGQKVKLVLAAAMWNRPHVIVLDEPTNYLDREALGALTQAIKAFAGGIVIISHNKEFTDALCTEHWLVKDKQCFTHGEVEETSLKASSSSSVKRSKSAPVLEEKADNAGGNTNKSIQPDVILNPKTLECLSKKEIRKLERCAAVAGVSLKDYVSKINNKSPEWKWL